MTGGPRGMHVGLFCAPNKPEMRRSEAPPLLYSVEISPAAWSQLGYLSVETYRRIREELDAVAAALTPRRERAVPQAVPGQGTAPARPTVVVDDVLALYEVDSARRRIVLVEVARRFSQEP